MLIVGFLPGLKVTLIPLLKQINETKTVMTGEFVTDIREFSTSVSGSNAPAAIIMFCDYNTCMRGVIEKLDYAMSPETIIVGDTLSKFRCTIDAQFGTSAAVAFVFAVDSNKPPGIGETQFHAVLSSGLSPVGPTYTSVIGKTGLWTELAARREGSVENIDSETILNQVNDELGGRSDFLFIGVTKKRKYSIGQEKVGCMTSLSFHRVCGRSQEYLFVHGGDLKTGDTFRFYNSTYATALSSAAVVSRHLRSFNQRSNNTSVGGKLEVFGGLIFTCPDMFGILCQPNINSSPFLDNFPGVTLGGIFSNKVIGRRVLTKYVKESQEQKTLPCCMHVDCSVYLVMSYTSLK